MNKKNCDRCGQEIIGNTVYKIYIHAESINDSFGINCEAAFQNLATNIKNLFNGNSEYCKKCKYEIEDFICNGTTEVEKL